MVCEYIISFDLGLPSMGSIVERLIDVTGLKVEYDSNNHLLFVKGFDLPTSIIADGAHYLVLQVGSIKIDYLLGATIYTLKSFGGKYDGYVPDWASQKWEDIKSNFSSLPNVGLPNIMQN